MVYYFVSLLLECYISNSENSVTTATFKNVRLGNLQTKVLLKLCLPQAIEKVVTVQKEFYCKTHEIFI